IGKIFYPDNFGVLLLDETTGVLHAHTSYQVREGIEILTIPPGCGITGQVAVTGLPMRVPDVTCEPAYLEGDPLTRSELCVPLKAGEQILGVINVESTRLDALSEADERLLTTFAGQLATAIEKVRLMGTLEQRVADRTRELTALYDVTTVAGESMDLRMTLEQSLERALVAMRSNAGAIHLLDEAGKALRLAVQQGISPDFAAQIHTVPSDNDLADWVIKHHEPLVVSDLEVDPRNPQATSMPSCHTYIGVPMRARRQVLGVLSVVREAERQFNVEEVALLASIADHVAVAVENARLRQRAQRAAVIEERERLARELHDSVTQSLYSLTLFAEAGRELAGDGRQEQVQHYLSRIGDTSQQALKEMRLLVHELRPYALERKGLVEALRQRLESVEKRSGVEACLLAEELIELKAPVEEGLYRIAQEALNNSLKHAAATSVTVCVHTEGEVVELEVVDDGIGFALDAASGSGGLGLTNMRDRAERMGGTLTILSVPGEGTRVMVKLEVSQ
ncbi:MAG: GAF domain-containing protein, partial [Chloroflexota bacterium]|nr:GAF domain-containing protein [Chloroflexota bacterium]